MTEIFKIPNYWTSPDVHKLVSADVKFELVDVDVDANWDDLKRNARKLAEFLSDTPVGWFDEFVHALCTELPHDEYCHCTRQECQNAWKKRMGHD